MKRERKGQEKRGDQPLDILNRGGQEALLAHVLNAEHAGIAKAVIDFGLREDRSIVCFLQL